MKGLIFTELLEMMEDRWGYEMVNELLSENPSQSKGVYTAVGTYPFSELAGLLGLLSRKTQIPADQLLQAFGHHLFGLFEKQYSAFLLAADNAFDFLESIHGYIHVEVRKLYPDAQLPHFETRRLNEQQLEMIYTSERKLSDLAAGLIESCLRYFRTEATLSREPLTPDGSRVRFIITKS